MLLPKTAFYKPRIPRSELKLPTIKFPSFFQTHARGNVTQNVPKTVTTEVPSSVSDLASGYNSAELVNVVELDSGNQGLRMAASGIAGFFSGGNSGVIEGIVGSMISNISNPGRRNTIDDIKPRKTGEIWKEIFSNLSPQKQRWITNKPALPETPSGSGDYFDDLISRTRTIAGLRNEIDKRFNMFLTGDTSQENLITSTELDENIKRIEDMRRITGENALGRGNALDGVGSSLLSIKPPIKSVDGWLYLENTETLPPLDRLIIKSYSYDKYLEAIA